MSRPQDEIHDLGDIEREYQAELRPRTSHKGSENDNDDVEVEELSRRLRRTPAPTQLSSTPVSYSADSRVYIELEDEETVETTIFAPATPSTLSTGSMITLNSRTTSSRRRQRQFTDLDNEDIEVQTPTKRPKTNKVFSAEAPEDILARLHEVRRLHAQNQSSTSARRATITRESRYTSTVRSTRESTVRRSDYGMSLDTAIILDDD